MKITDWNRDERIFIAAHYMLACRMDWSNSSQVADWLEWAETYLPDDLKKIMGETDEEFDEYIQHTQEDGRYCRPDYEMLFGLVNKENVSQAVHDFIEEEFKFF